jgi:hypothetical protein
VSIQWLEQRLSTLTGSEAPVSELQLAAVAAALLADRDRALARPSHQSPVTGHVDHWRDAGRRDALR